MSERKPLLRPLEDCFVCGGSGFNTDPEHQCGSMTQVDIAIPHLTSASICIVLCDCLLGEAPTREDMDSAVRKFTRADRGSIYYEAGASEPRYDGHCTWVGKNWRPPCSTS